MVHCWEDYASQFEIGSPEWNETFLSGNKTCMLEKGHVGPHEWTPDSDITVGFL